jgi:uncharacterized glyoxalase superfamily protein PhnB
MTPTDWPRITSALFYRDAPAAIAWLCRAFGFAVRSRVDTDDGSVAHSELTFGDGLVLVYTADDTFQTPAAVGGANTQTLTVYVDDVDAHCATAQAAGAALFRELGDTRYSDTWVDRTYGALDPEGHRWFFSQRLSGR